MSEPATWVLVIRHGITVVFGLLCVSLVWFLCRWMFESVWIAVYFTAALVLRIATDRRVWKGEQ